MTNENRSKNRKTRRAKMLQLAQTDSEKIHLLHAEIDALRWELRHAQTQALDMAVVRNEIFKLGAQDPNPPKWVVSPKKRGTESLGIPTIFASDWHWGEVVFPSQIENCNEFNLEIANRRCKALITNSCDLLFNYLQKPKYDGVVFALGGDMVSGNIHEELAQTNEIEMLPICLDLYEKLIWCVDSLLLRFGRVHIPVVAGNHGRTTRKPIHKNRAYGNYDWWVGMMLELYYKKDPRVTFHIPDGTDARYDIYSHKYLLTHGDQFSGGDGIIGAIGPVLRGDAKKNVRENQIGNAYDTMICGHFHQLVITKKAIINGSLKGYDEYAYAHNFGYEKPQQAMWITHPDHGITFNFPIFLDEPNVTRAIEKLTWYK